MHRASKLSEKCAGRDYPITGREILLTFALKRMSPNTLDDLGKKGGKGVGCAHSVVAKDGNLWTYTLKERNAKGQDVTATEVYDKQ